MNGNYASPETEDEAQMEDPSQTAGDTQQPKVNSVEDDLIEAKAIRQGWSPADTYEGDPKKWVDAATFVKRGERFVGNLEREVKQLQAKLASFEGTKAQFIKFHEETISRKDAELKGVLQELREQRSQAQAEGEHAQAVLLEDQIESVKEQQQALRAPAVPTQNTAATGGVDMQNPVIVEWIADGNQWFRDEPKLRDYAIAIGSDLVNNGVQVKGRAFLDKVMEVMRTEFPRRFKSAAQGNLGNASAPLPNETPTGNSVGGYTARTLPEVDRMLMQQFIREGYTTEAKFLESYNKTNKR